MKLSVIVPVYQVEAYLPACLDSLLEQGLSDTEYEIICVDDGSMDRSGEIAEEYARRHPQVFVLHQANGGLSAARNAGMRAASGEYVYFIDSDDLLEKNILGALYDLAVDRNLDQLLFDYERFTDEAGAPSGGRRVDPDRLTLFRDPLEMRRCQAVPAWRIACNYLIRRPVLEEYGLTFPEGVMFEDKEFNFWLDRCAASCGYLDQKLYYYRQREGSILNTFMSDGRFPGYIQGRVRLAESCRNRLAAFRAGTPPKLRVPVTEEELEIKLIDEVQGILNRLFAKGDREMCRRTLAALEEKGLYPYPLRWRRLLRRKSFGNWGIDVVSFLFPVRWYFQFFLQIRMVFR